MADVEGDLTDSLVMSLSDTPVRGVAASETDTIGFAPTLASYYGLVLLERLRFAPSQITNQIAGLVLADTVRLQETLGRGITALLEETIGVELTQALGWVAQVVDTLQLAPTLAANATLHATLTQTLRLLDNLGQFFGAELSDGIGFEPTMLERLLASVALSDKVGIELTAQPQWLLNVEAADGIAITPSQALQMVYDGQLADGVELSAGFISPSGDFTTWTMNAHTGAVTEYDNFAFNSFARMGDRYLGASADGLYELLGDMDDDAAIIPRIRSGFMQFGGTHLSRLKEAYLAARGEGDWVLKIITGEGLEYNYACTNQNVRSTRIPMGKGQRARYFAFELVGDGTDFDLDTLEFVPIVMQRRV